MLELIKAYSAFINESKTENLGFSEFAKARLEGATKITEAAKAKGGSALLTYHHFKVKLPYYKKATEGKFNVDSMQKELSTLIQELAQGTSGQIKLNQVKFQIIVGKIEVIGELLIKHRDK
jgi:hypothetical protein